MPDVCDPDADGDGAIDACDGCPDDPNKTEPGDCGCGVQDNDTDGDGIADCIDPCPNWPYDCSDDGQTITVAVGQSIQVAINAVPSGGTVLLAAGTYTEAIDFGSKNLVLEGDASDPSSVVLDGTGATDTVVKIIGGQTSATVVRGVTIQNGTVGMLLPAQEIYVGGGMMIRNSDPVVEDVVFVANRSQFGGGLYVLGSESVLTGCSFLFNVADEDGGGVFIQNADVEITDGFFDGNTAVNQGGAVKVVIGESVLSNCVMTSNVANEGGGIYWFANADTTPLRVDDVTITGNQASSSGGGIKTRSGQPGVDLTNATICGNSPDQIFGDYTDLGGSCISEVCDTDADGTRDCDDNCPEDPNKTEPGDCGCGVADTDTDGDGIADCVDPCPNWPYDCSEDGQTIFVAVGQSIQDAIDAVPDGGTVAIAAGVYNEAVDFGTKNLVLQGDASDPSSVVLDGTGLVTSVVSIVGDQTSSSRVIGLTIANGSIGSPLPGQPTSRIGGGLFVRDSSPLIQDCIFESNTSGFGGAVYVLNGASIFDRCDFIGNIATTDGGGIFAFGSAGRVSNCMLDSNTAVNHGGGIKVVLGAFRIIDTQIIGNGGHEGGGLYWFANAGTLPLRVTGCTITGNTANKVGGGIKSRVGFPAVNLTNATICGNSPDQVSGVYTDLGGNCISEVCDTDADGTRDCDDLCPNDPNKTEPGDCGCGVPDTDTDGDGTADCLDLCPNDPNKTEPGACGCGVADTDTDGDGIADCNDPCPNWPYDCSEDGQTIFVSVDQSIQVAINAVPSGGTVLLAAGTYTEAIDFGSKNLVLEGDASDPSSVVLDGTGATDTVVKIIGGQTSATVVRGVTIQNGTVGMLLPAQEIYVGGGMMIRNSDPVVEDVVFVANRSQFGGGLYVLGSESVLTGCSFLFNVADEDGGGVFIQNADVEITDGFFDGNTAVNQGGAVKVVIGESVLSNCVMTSNVANEGGGIYWFANADTTPLRVDDVTITGNQASSSGGGIKTRSGQPGVDLTNATICGNSPDQIFGDYTDLGGSCISEVCDTDADGTRDCDDNCPEDPNKTEPGDCGCGVADTDTDGDGIADCVDPCPNWPYDCSEDGQTIFVAVGQSIQNAIDVVPAGGTVVLSEGTYAISGEFGLVHGVGEFSIRGAVDGDGNPATILDAEDSGRILSINFGQTSASVFENLVFTRGSRAGSGGALGIGNGSSPLVRNCVFEANHAGTLGGAVMISASSPTFEDCVFRSNDSTDGGAIFATDGSSPTLVGCLIFGNVAENRGGGIYILESDGNFTDCDFEANVTTGDGSQGGAIYNDVCSPEFADCRFVGNTATFGSAMYNRVASANLVGCIFFANTGTEVTGAVHNYSESNGIFDSCIFEANLTAASEGGGVFNQTSNPTILDSRICSNIPDQVSGVYTDLGGNCISEVCDTDGDGTLDCDDLCPEDPNKTEPGDCGCGVAESGDTDGDGTPDCLDNCPEDPDKTEPGDCGCGVPESGDADGDGIADCIDPCPNWPYDCSEDGQTIVVAVGQSVQTAIEVVPDGGTVLLSAGSYNEAIDLGSKNLVLQGDAADPSSVVLDGADLETSVISITGGQNSTTMVIGVTIRNGMIGSPLPGQPTSRVGGGLFVDSSSPTIRDCVFDSNRSGFGGAIYLRYGAADLEHCTFTGNSATTDGGAIFAFDPYGEIFQCSISGNTAVNHGGGVKIVLGEMDVVETQIEENQAGQGGGLYWFANADTAPLQVIGCNIVENMALEDGGGIKTREGFPGVELSNTTVCDNAPDEVNGEYVDLGGNTLCICIGDLTGDGLVNGADLGILLGSWGPCPPTGSCIGDVTGDGQVTGADLGLLLGSWGECIDP